MVSVQTILRARANKDNLHPLQIRITLRGKSLRYNIGKSIKKDQWDNRLKKVKKTHLNSTRLNNLLIQKKAEITNTVVELETKDEYFTLDDIKKRLNPTKSSNSVFKRSELFFNELWKSGKFNRYSGEIAAINHFKKFRNKKDLSFEEFNVAMLRDFKAYLLGTIGISQSSTVNYFITLRSIYNRAIIDGVVDQAYYPFGKKGIKLKRRDSLKVGLIEEEVKAIESLELPKGSFIDHARNVWLISFYFAGLRIGDLLLLKWSDMQNGRLYYQMNKNEKSDSVKISDKAQKVLDFYKDMKNSYGLVFPDLNNVRNIENRIEVEKAIKYRGRKINNYLGKIQKELELTKPLTNHIARHSFATIAGDKIPIQRLQQLYRHSSITTTINYQKAFMNKGTDDALDKVLDF